METENQTTKGGAKAMLKRFAAPLAAIVVATAAMSGATGMAEKTVAENAEYIVKVSYTGNKEHDQYEYYAVDDKDRAVKISEKELPDDIIDDAEDMTAYSDRDSDYWFIDLAEYEKEENIKGDGWVKSELGKDMYVAWFEWTDYTEKPKKEDKDVFHEAAEFLYDEDSDDWMWEGFGGRGLEDFVVVKNEDRYLLSDERERILYRKDEEDGFVKLMEMPDGSKLDYCWFR